MSDDSVTFWTNGVSDPAFQWRFRVTHQGEFLWWAKTCDKPKVNIPVLGKDEYYLGSCLPDTRPGEILDYQPLTMTLVDPDSGEQGTGTGLLASTLMASLCGGGPRIDPDSFMSTWDNLTIEVIGADGSAHETWVLNDPFPTAIDFGSLSYSSDDLVELTITWEYSSFSVNGQGPSTGRPEPKQNLIFDGALT
jgi:hypothetical protein